MDVRPWVMARLWLWIMAMDERPWVLLAMDYGYG